MDFRAMAEMASPTERWNNGFHEVGAGHKEGRKEGVRYRTYSDAVAAKMLTGGAPRTGPIIHTVPVFGERRV